MVSGSFYILLRYITVWAAVNIEASVSWTPIIYSSFLPVQETKRCLHINKRQAKYDVDDGPNHKTLTLILN